MATGVTAAVSDLPLPLSAVDGEDVIRLALLGSCNVATPCKMAGSTPRSVFALCVFLHESGRFHDEDSTHPADDAVGVRASS